MRRIALIAVLLLLAAAAAGWGWWSGAFAPCGRFDGLFNGGRCQLLAALDDANIQAIGRLPDGRLIAVLREPGENPQAPQRLATIDPASGATIAAVPIDGLPPDASWMTAAVSPDGRSIAAGTVDDTAYLIDIASGRVTGRIDYGNAAHIGFTPDGTGVMVDRGTPLSTRGQLGVERYALNGVAGEPVRGAEAAPIFARGVSQALSSDGRLMVIERGEEDRPDGAGVALWIGPAATPDQGGRVLTGAFDTPAPSMPRLWFSPDGAWLAAAWWASPLHGEEQAALFIWNVATGELAVRVPSVDSWNELVWLDGGRIAVERYDADARRSEIRIVRYAPQ